MTRICAFNFPGINQHLLCCIQITATTLGWKKFQDNTKANRLTYISLGTNCRNTNHTRAECRLETAKSTEDLQKRQPAWYLVRDVGEWHYLVFFFFQDASMPTWVTFATNKSAHWLATEKMTHEVFGKTQQPLWPANILILIRKETKRTRRLARMQRRSAIFQVFFLIGFKFITLI